MTPPNKSKSQFLCFGVNGKTQVWIGACQSCSLEMMMMGEGERDSSVCSAQLFFGIWPLPPHSLPNPPSPITPPSLKPHNTVVPPSSYSVSLPVLQQVSTFISLYAHNSFDPSSHLQSCPRQSHLPL